MTPRLRAEHRQNGFCWLEGRRLRTFAFSLSLYSSDKRQTTRCDCRRTIRSDFKSVTPEPRHLGQLRKTRQTKRRVRHGLRRRTVPSSNRVRKMRHAPPASGVVAGDADFAPNLMGDVAPTGGATWGAVVKHLAAW